MPSQQPSCSLNEWLSNTCTCWARQRFAYNVAALDIYKELVRMDSETVMEVQEMHSLLPISVCGSTSLYETTARNCFHTVFSFLCEKMRNDLTAQKREVCSNTSKYCSCWWMTTYWIPSLTITVKYSSMHAVPLAKKRCAWDSESRNCKTDSFTEETQLCDILTSTLKMLICGYYETEWMIASVKVERHYNQFHTYKIIVKAGIAHFQFMLQWQHGLIHLLCPASCHEKVSKSFLASSVVETVYIIMLKTTGHLLPALVLIFMVFKRTCSTSEPRCQTCRVFMDFYSVL